MTRAKGGFAREIAAWISGYVSAKRDTTIADRPALRGRIRELRDYCYEQKNYKVPVMKAVEELFGKKK